MKRKDREGEGYCTLCVNQKGSTDDKRESEEWCCETQSGGVLTAAEERGSSKRKRWSSRWDSTRSFHGALAARLGWQSDHMASPANRHCPDKAKRGESRVAG